MGSKVAQTPGGFVEAGDTGLWFSPDCVKALQNMELNPDAFGSYAHVATVKRETAARVAAWDHATTNGLSTAGMTPPTAGDRMVANSESGHLVQNAIGQTDRRNGCSNIITGWDHDLAPACPMDRGTGAGSESAVWASSERAQLDLRRDAAGVPRGAVSNPTAPGVGGYPPDDRRDDQAERAGDLAAQRQASVRSYESPAAPGEADRPGMTGPDRPPTAREQAASARAATDPTSNVVTGGDAAECISNFVDAQEAAMRANCQNNLAQNAATAANPAAANRRLAQIQAEANAESNKMDRIGRQIDQSTRAGAPGRHVGELMEARANAQTRFADLQREAREIRAAGCMRDQALSLDGTAPPAPQTHGSFPQ